MQSFKIIKPIHILTPYVRYYWILEDGADVSVSETTFVSNTTSKIETIVTAETTVNPTVSQETKSLKTDTKSEEKADSGEM